MAVSTSTLDEEVRAARARYAEANAESARLHAEAAEVMPGGNTRAVIHWDPFPLALARSEGKTLEDVDGHVYVDLLGDFTAGLFGHSHPLLSRAIMHALEGGTTRGGRNPDEARLASALRSRIPSLELLRFCNSGSEATLFPVLLARAVTGKPALLAFEGAYHGGFLQYPDGPGPMNVPIETLLAPYNDPEAAAAAIAANADRLAAVIVEPMQGSAGVIPGEPAFLEALRAACTEHGVILIFDEVMTSRLAPGGIQGAYGVIPDLTALGKYLGGGMPFGAFGGRRDLMERFDPSRPDALVHSGTFNNDPMKLAAGIVGLTQIFTPAECRRLNALGDRLRDRLNAAAESRGVPFQATGLGSMLGLHFTRATIHSVRDLAGEDPAHVAALRELMHLDLLAEGFYVARRGFIALNLALNEADVDAFGAAVERFLDARGSLLTAA
jgi:glutamate-1-semialdehyde 2,1-aminomutase